MYALVTMFKVTGTHHSHRDIASLIAYLLHEARTAPMVSAVQRRGTIQRPAPGRASPVTLVAPSQASSDKSEVANRSKLSMAELGLRVLEVYADLVCGLEDQQHLKRFVQNVPGRVS